MFNLLFKNLSGVKLIAWIFLFLSKRRGLATMHIVLGANDTGKIPPQPLMP